jgi:hypothetical protein
MAGMAVNDIVAVSFRGTLFSQRILNIFHYVVSVAGTGTVVEQLQAFANGFIVDALGCNFQTDFLACLAPSYVLDEVRTQRVYPTRSIYTTATADVPGTYATDTEVANIAASILKRTETPGRMGIGRVQLAGIPTAVYENGGLTNAYANGQLSNLATDMLFSLTEPARTVTYVPCLYNPSSTGEKFSVLSAATPQLSLRTMHRRTLRVGE